MEWRKFKMNSVEQQFIDLINAELNVVIDQTHFKMNLDDLGVNSLVFVQLVVAIESHFDIEFENIQLLNTNFSDANSIIRYIEKRLEEV
ncbi:acyl carrier protein [Paenibacillus psychroresistens]|uniref:Acyl carrier protein n=2 Tax=Paenibacillus psychroresistens TaxID=1778678 RepID=A0A6B8RJW9_9BACL|nr:acyl carrier protein [Paenibacillus psychroresistens]